MQDLYTKLFNEELLVVLKTMLDEFVSNNASEDEIYKELRSVNCSVRECLYLMAQEYCEYPMLEKLQSVLEKIADENIELFKSSVENNEVNKYLSTFQKIDKIALLEDLQLNKDVLSEKEKLYKDLLLKSIRDDQQNENRDGVDTFIKYHKN